MDRNDPDGIMVFCGPVALRKESVDRNSRNNGKIKKSNQVALRKESVDRNEYTISGLYKGASRSPQGERG